MSIMVTFILGVFSSEIFTFIFPEEYASGVQVFKCLLIVLNFNVISSLYGYPAYTIINKERIVNFIMLMSSVLHALSLAFLFYLEEVSVMNVAFALLLTELITMLVRVIVFYILKKRFYEINFN